jgi:hypothetical protein
MSSIAHELGAAPDDGPALARRIRAQVVRGFAEVFSLEPLTLEAAELERIARPVAQHQ